MRTIEEYRQIISRQLATSLSSRTKLTFDAQKISEAILKECPELRSAQLVLPFMGRRPVVELTSRSPALVLQSGSQKLIVDKTGKSIADVSRLSEKSRGQITAAQLTDSSGVKLEVGKNILPASDVNFITTVISQLSQKTYVVSSMELPASASDVHIRLDGTKYFIKFNMLTDPQVAVGQYLAWRQQTERGNEEQPTEYVDVRVEGKVFTK